jgi:hypothetical protein
LFKNKKKQIVILIVINILLLILLDIFLTKFYKAIISDKNNIVVKHPIYHHTFKSNSYKNQYFRENYTIFTNSLGFKSNKIESVDLKNKKKSRRILFIGDSFTEGVGLNYEDTFVGIIDKKLSENNIEVLNAAQSSYSPIIYWRKIKHLLEVENLNFTDVVVFIDISDAEDEAKKYALDKFGNVIDRINNKNQSLNNKYFIDIYSIIQNTTLINYSINKLRNIYINQKYETKEWHDFIRSEYTRDKWTINKDAYDDYGKIGEDLMIKYMDRLNDMLAKKNINLTVAVYPWPSQIWHEDLNSRQVLIWENWCNKNNINLLNYFPLFIKKKTSNKMKIDVIKEYYFVNDIHLNKNGHRLIANYFLLNFK